MSTKIKVIFTISLLINILCIGIFSGHTFKRQWSHGHYKDYHYQKVVALVAELPEQQRGIFQDRLDALKEDNKDKRQKIRSLRSRALDLLKSDTFEPAAYDEITEDIILLKVEMGKSRAALLRDLAEALPDHAREQLLDSLRHRR